jgi:hypothetical protein
MPPENIGYPPRLNKEAMVAECGELIQLTIEMAETLDARTIQSNFYYIEFLDLSSGSMKLHQLVPDQNWSIVRPLTYYIELEKRGLIRNLQYFQVPRASRDAYLAQFGLSA